MTDVVADHGVDTLPRRRAVYAHITTEAGMGHFDEHVLIAVSQVGSVHSI